MRHMGKLFGVGLLGLVVTGMTVWGMGALYYSALPALLRSVLATAGAFLGLSHRRRTLLGFVLVWGALVGWWSTITPSNARDWQPDVAVLPSATVDGDLVTLHNIRNVEYRRATDFTPRYYDKTFDLRRLESVDLMSSYWAGEAIAHLFGSFGFGGQEYVAISAETRKERTEDYNITTTGAAIATVGALIVAKVILIVGKLPLARLFSGRMLYNVLWKTSLFSAVSLLFRVVEELLPLLAKHNGLVPAATHLFEEVSWLHFWVLQMWLYASLLLYCLASELVRLIGAVKVKGMLLGAKAIAS